MNKISVGEWAILLMIGLVMNQHHVDIEKMSYFHAYAVEMAATATCIACGWLCWRIWND